MGIMEWAYDSDQPFNFLKPHYAPLILGRIGLIQKLEDRPEFVALMGRHYSRNPIDFIEDLLITQDSRNVIGKASSTMPFILMKRQRDLINWLQQMLENGSIKKTSGLVSKCRDAGLSWLCCAFALWLFLFHPESIVGFCSLRKTSVDNLGDPNSLFEKIRIMIRRLPQCFQPIGWDEKKHALDMRLVNPENGAVITGWTGASAGRSGRSSIFFIDEAAWLENQDDLAAALQATSNCVISLSTINGPHNLFYRMQLAFQESNDAEEYFRLFEFDWWQDERKTPAWFKAEAANFTKMGCYFLFEQEVLRNADAQNEDAFIPHAWIKSAIDYPVEEEGATCRMGLDVGDSGKDLSVLMSARGIRVSSDIVEWRGEDGNVAAKKVLKMAKRTGATLLIYDRIGVGSKVETGINALKIMEGKLPFTEQAFVCNEGVVDPTAPVEFGTKQGVTNYDMFDSQKSQFWWAIREACRCSHENLTNPDYAVGQELRHPEHKCISLPNHPQLIRELGAPKLERKGRDQINVESKKDMLKRDIPSTNHADACIMLWVRKKIERAIRMGMDGVDV